MEVWAVWTQSGEYEQHHVDLRGVFASAELANQFLGALIVDDPENKWIEEKAVLSEMPTLLTLHTWADHVGVDGSVSPAWQRYPAGFGQQRHHWPIWSHDEAAVAVKGEIRPWGQEGDIDRFVEVSGTD